MYENITYFYVNCTDNKLEEYNTLKKNKPELFVYDETTSSYIEKTYDCK